MLWRLFLIAVLLGSVGGCVSVNAARLNSTVSYPAVDPKDVAVYMNEADVKKPYEKVALLNSSGASSWTNEESLINGMKQKAGELGANGIILNSLQDADSGTKIAGAILGTSADRHGQAVAIRVQN